MKLISVLLLCIALLLTGCSEPSRFVSTDISAVEWGKDFSLTDHHGKPARLADFRGKVVVLFFGYTQCPDGKLRLLIRHGETPANIAADLKRLLASD